MPTAIKLAVIAILLLLPLATGCSVKRIAANNLADALADGESVFASDDDPQLIREATPFSLKLMESVLAETPRHRKLLTAAARGFTQYGYAFVQDEADQVEPRDLAAASAMRIRARKLFLRPRDYGLRGLDVAHPGMSQRLRKNAKQALGETSKPDVPLLYWTAAAWGAAVNLSKNDPELVSDQVIVEALIDRALTLDESYEHGAIHMFLISYESARQGAGADWQGRARTHLERAVELSAGKQAAPYVAFAEAVCVPKQNRAEFESLLKTALAIDVDAQPQYRLANLVMQRRASWLLSRVNELFVQ